MNRIFPLIMLLLFCSPCFSQRPCKGPEPDVDEATTIVESTGWFFNMLNLESRKPQIENSLRAAFWKAHRIRIEFQESQRSGELKMVRQRVLRPGFDSGESSRGVYGGTFQRR